MSTLQITLPDTVRALVREQVNSGRFSTESEYLCHLIEDDQKRRSREELESLLLSRVNGSETVEMNSTDWQHMRDEFQRRIAGSRK
jgi:Arc/MetJ-type ribon-helix-helix transcriptional regulator